MTAVSGGAGTNDRIAPLLGETLALAGQLRSYLESDGGGARALLPPKERLDFANEALNATTRLVRLTSWLTAQRAGGERGEGAEPGRRASLRPGTTPDSHVLGGLPTPARRLILAGIELHERVGRFADGVDAPIATVSAVRGWFPVRERPS